MAEKTNKADLVIKNDFVPVTVDPKYILQVNAWKK